MAKNEAKVIVSADNKKLKRGLDDSKKQVSGFSKGIKDAAGVLGQFAGPLAIGAVVKGLFDWTKQMGETADRLLDLEQITNLSTDRLQEYEHVARIAGVNSETMSNAVIGLTQRLARGAEMSASLKQGLEALNIEAFDSAGSLRDLGTVTEEALAQLAGMEDITKRNVIGAQLFSGAWKDLAPVLALGADGLEAAKKEARELGLVMDREALVKANEYRIELEKMNAQFKMSKQEIAMGVMPIFQQLVSIYSETINNIRSITASLREMVGPEVVSGMAKVFGFIQKIGMWQHQLIGITANYLKNRKETEETEAEIAERIWEQKVAAQELKEQTEATDAAAKQIEADRREALGIIGRLQEDIATAETNRIQSNSIAEQNRWSIRKAQLEEELRLINELNSVEGLGGQEADRWGLTTGLTPITPMGGGLIDNQSEIIEGLKQQQIELKKTGEAAAAAGENFVDFSNVAMGAAHEIGAAFGEMAQSGARSTEEIISQMLRQITALLLQSIMASALPLPAKLAAALGAGALSSGIFSSQVPSYATGTNNHPGGLALVGERGPELVNLPGGSQVFTNRESMGMMGGKVEFEIRGDKLYGLLQRYSNRLNQNT